MKAKLSFIIAIGLLVFTCQTFAQNERMSEADYGTALSKALESSSSRERRVISVETFYNGSQVTGTRKITSEFAGADARKIEVVEKFDNGVVTSDSVKIGDQFICREGKRAWKHSNKDCSKNAAMAIPAGDYEYWVETDPKSSGRKIYTRRAKFIDSGLAERDAVRLKFIEIKFVADENGIIEYTETRRGGIGPNGWSSTQVTKYEYNPKDLKITDPTKESF